MGGIAEFTAQAGDVHVNGTFVAFKLVAPNRGKKLLAGTDTAYIEEKVLENTVFKGREFQSFAFEGNAAALLDRKSVV